MSLIGISETLGGYNETAETALEALDQAQGLRPFVAVMPEPENTSIAGNGTYEARVSVPVGSRIWGISGMSGQPEGATVQVTDSKTQKPLFSQPVDIANVTGGSLSVKDSAGIAHTYKSPLHLLAKSGLVLAPGILQVKIVNLSAVANKLQVALHFSVPNGGQVTNPNAADHELAAELDLANRAVRDVGTGQLITATGDTSSGPAAPAAAPSIVDTLIRVPFDISAAGDNVIVAGNAAGRVSIYQLDIWNAAGAQDITLKDGSSNQLRGPLANFPAQTGYALGFQDAYHFQLSPGNSFIINLSNGTRLTGFVRYRME